MGPRTTDRRILRGPAAWIRARRLHRFEDRVGAPIHEGNRVKVLVGGRAAVADIVGAIEAARRAVAVEMYTWADDRLGRRVAQAAGARAREGIPVFVLLDAFGSLGGDDLAAYLEGEGARVLWYHPLAPWTPDWYPNRRNHRKLVLVDGVTGFTGGINLAEVYSEEFAAENAWRDLMVRVEGPAVREMARMFVANWVRSGGSLDVAESLMALPRAQGKARVQVVGGRGLRGRRSLLRSYLDLIALARERIFLANAYFAPEAGLRRQLCWAARRGVRVELLVPGKSDAPYVRWAGRASYQRLLDAGVRLREMDHAVLHVKMAAFDDRVLLAGSANLDYRSFRHNLEVAVNVFDRGAAAEALRAFEAEFARSRPVLAEEWASRSGLDRLRERLAYLFRYWL